MSSRSGLDAGDGRHADRLEVVGVDQHGVVEALPGARPTTTAAMAASTDAAHGPPAPARRRPAAGPAGAEQSGRGPLVGREADVAAGEGQPVGLAHGRAPDHLDGQRQVGAIRRTTASCWKSFRPK